MRRGRHAVGYVVTFSRTWNTGLRPLKISVLVEDPGGTVFAPRAGDIAALLVRRACLLFRCEPRDLTIGRHPCDGFVWRRV